MVSRKSDCIADPVLPDQGGREMPVDPGGPAREDAVRRRAYELYQRRGGKEGHDLQDWLEAENEVQNDDGLDAKLAAKTEIAAAIVTTALR